MIQMTYQKKNGEIIRRTISSFSPYRIGDTNSYGWKVIDIKYNYNNKYYPKSEYDALVYKSLNRSRIISRYKRSFVKFYKELIYVVYLLLITRVFQIISSTM